MILIFGDSSHDLEDGWSFAGKSLMFMSENFAMPSPTLLKEDLDL